jgi:rfaE bifunctional protein kinase chain/domain
MNLPRLKKILSGWAGRRVMVLGDFVADEYLFGLTTRISREAPVLILRYVSKEVGLGGAGNAAHNLASLGARVTPVGTVGRDEMGREMLRLIKGLKMDTAFLFVDADRPTTAKTRILAGGTHTTRQQVIRIDRGEYDRYTKAIEEKILRVLDRQMGGMDALLVSDYQYGALTPRVIDKVNAVARAGRLIVTVDSRYRMLKFRHAAALTPNEPEVEEALGVRLDGQETTLRSVGERILNETKSQAVLITRGSEGMALILPEGKTHLVPVFGSDEVADVTGAGDTVIAIFTLALAAGAAPLEAAHLANVGGGLVVMKRGAATVNPEELSAALARAAG